MFKLHSKMNPSLGDSVRRTVRVIQLAGCLLAMMAVLPLARAGDSVTEMMQGAYAPYRMALISTSRQAQPESEQAIAQAMAEWRGLVQRYATKPPPPYDRDPGFARTLDEVTAVYERALEQIHDKKLAQAHETLEQVRGLVAELRRRNDVVTYSDRMNEYHAAMEQMLREDPHIADGPQAAMRLMARVGVLEYLAARLRSEAPKALSQTPEFAPLVQAVEESVWALHAAVMAQDEAAIRKALGDLKAPYSLLFVKFG